MAGFFGESWEDPKTQMILAMASGLLGNRGNFGQGVSAGLMGGVGAFNDARKMQMLAEQQRVQQDKMRAEAEWRKALQAKGIDPDEHKDITKAKWFMQLPNDQKALALQAWRGDSQLAEMNGILHRFSRSGYGESNPLTTLQAEGDAQQFLAAMKSRGTEEQKALFDMTSGYNPATRRLESVPRASQVGPLPPLVAPGGPRLPSASAPGSYGGMPGYMNPQDQQRAWSQFGDFRLPNDQMQPAPPPGAAATPPVAPPSPRLAPPEQAKRDDESRTETRRYQNILTQIREAKTWLPSATNSGVGKVLDIAGAAVGVDLPGASAAKRLESIAGWLTSNVPRMEGPQSNFDVQVYQKMAADVGNAGLPMSQRLAALETLESLMMKQEAIRQQLSGGQQSQPSAQETAGGGPAVGDRAKTKDGRNVEWDGKGWKVVP